MMKVTQTIRQVKMGQIVSRTSNDFAYETHIFKNTGLVATDNHMMKISADGSFFKNRTRDLLFI